MNLDKQTIAWTTGIIVVTIAFLSLVTWPQFDRICQSRERIQATRDNQQQGQETARAIADLQRELTELASETADFDLRVPDRERLDAFLREMARCAQARDVNPDNIEPGAPERAETVVALPIRFNVQGPFDAIHGLIQDIERMDRLACIDELGIETDRDDPGSVSANVALKIFFKAS